MCREAIPLACRFRQREVLPEGISIAQVIYLQFLTGYIVRGNHIRCIDYKRLKSEYRTVNIQDLMLPWRSDPVKSFPKNQMKNADGASKKGMRRVVSLSSHSPVFIFLRSICGIYGAVSLPCRPSAPFCRLSSIDPLRSPGL